MPASRGAGVILTRGATFIAALAMTLILCGCSDPAPTQSENPWAPQFEAARSRTNLPEILAVLEDDLVTDEEYAQVVQWTLDCMADQGFEAEYVASDHAMKVHGTQSSTSEEIDAVFEDCSGPRWDPVSVVYWGMIDNPDNRDIQELRLECFQRVGILGDEVTLDDFNRIDFNDPSWDLEDPTITGCLGHPLSTQPG